MAAVTAVPDTDSVHASPTAGVKVLAFVGWAFAAAICHFISEASNSVSIGIVTSAVVLTLAGLAATRVLVSDWNGQFIRNIFLGPLFTLAFTLVFGVTTLRWLHPVEGSAALAPLDAFPRGALVGSLGLWCFVLGYKLFPAGLFVPVHRLLTRLTTAGNAPDRSSRAPLLLWLITMTSIASQVRTGTYEYLSSGEQASSSLPMVFAMVESLGMLASFLAAGNWARDRGPERFAVMVLVVGSQGVVGLFSGMKENVIVHALAALFAYYRWRRFRLAPLVAVAIFWFALLSPAITAYRSMVQVGSDRMSVSQVLERVSITDIFTAPAESASDDGDVGSTILRLSRTGDVAMIVDTVPDRISYKDPAELFAAPFLGFIPRSIWPEKPVMDTGYQMGALMYDLPPTVRTSFAVTPYGDLWWHGGVGAVGIGMAVMGGVVAFVDRMPRLKDDPRPLFLALLLVPIALKQEMDFTTTLMLGPSTFAAYFIGAWLTGRVTRNKEMASPTA